MAKSKSKKKSALRLTTVRRSKNFIPSGKMSKKKKYIKGGYYYKAKEDGIKYGMICKNCGKTYGEHYMVNRCYR